MCRPTGRGSVDLAHPFGVALGEVVVDGDDVDALAGERVEIDRQRRDQRLAFAGAHFGDRAVVQHHAADQLHVEMAHAEHALGGFANRGEVNATRKTRAEAQALHASRSGKQNA
jgi:hypothetical protein